ncbi:hypothetical protein FZW96_00170 [Bacillus sp. BGMRC 2118]|nr:hypothetical protein FZW96_00170 [Bacillus sp. BGMRC 2118]
MHYVLYFVIQFSLFSVLVLANFYLDDYISKPFTLTDGIATVIAIGIALAMVWFHGLKSRIKPLSRLSRIGLSIVAITLAILLIGLLTNQIVLE